MPYRPHLVSSTTRPIVRSLVQKVFGDFDPLRLDPYLFFDAATSMVGTLENPTLDLDPSKPDTLNVITATRAGTATFTDANGNIASASPNTVRVDYVDSVPMILVEPSATNLWDNTTMATWGTLNGTTVSNGLGYKNQTSKIITQSSGYGYADKAISTTSGASYTFSFYARLISGSATSIVARHRDSASGDVSSFSITPEFQKFEFTILGKSGGGDVMFGFRFNRAMPSETSSIEISMPQVEQGAVATSFIPTSGSTVTRAKDDLVISGSDFTDFYNQSEGTIYSEFVPKLESLDATLFNFSDGSNFNRIMSLTKFYHIFVTTSGNTQVQFASGSVSLNNLNRLAASFKTNDCVLSLNGSSEVVDSSMAMPSINQINIGARFGGTEHLQGHIRRLLYWPVSSDSL
jgi:hypothetical protein